MKLLKLKFWSRARDNNNNNNTNIMKIFSQIYKHFHGFFVVYLFNQIKTWIGNRFSAILKSMEIEIRLYNSYSLLYKYWRMSDAFRIHTFIVEPFVRGSSINKHILQIVSVYLHLFIHAYNEILIVHAYCACIHFIECVGLFLWKISVNCIYHRIEYRCCYMKKLWLFWIENGNDKHWSSVQNQSWIEYL